MYVFRALFRLALRKHETRNPKSETNSKHEFSKPRNPFPRSFSGGRRRADVLVLSPFRILDLFQVSNFEFRI